MLKKETSNWQISDETKGLLFFAQRIDEALFDYTPEKYKTSVLYSVNSCLEVLDTIAQVKTGIWPLRTLETVYEEFKHIYKNDDTAKSLVGDIDAYYLTNIDENNLDNLKANLELLYFKIKPTIYLEKVKEQLKVEITGLKRSIIIEKLALRFISVLTHKGYSQEFIYFETNNFFFTTNQIDNTLKLNEYFDIFNLVVCKFDVYLKTNKLFDQIKDVCSRFKTEIVTNVTLTDESVRKLNITENERLIKVSDIPTFDPQKARIIAQKRLSKISDLFTFFHHKQRLTWSESTIVFNQTNNAETYFYRKSSPMLKGYDVYPRKAAERLDLMLQKFDIHKDSFFRFNRSIDFHGTAIDNKYPENQLLQNWIALETLIVENKSSSKIDQLISALVPILNYEYIKRIFIELASDIERLNNPVVLGIINEVDTGVDIKEKLAALCTVEKYLPLAQRLFNECVDFPLLNYRIFWLNRNLADSGKVRTFIKNHTQRVEWHIRRMYRARNLIVHTGQVPTSIERLVESSHTYLDDVINLIMNLSINGQQIRTIDHGIREIKIRNKMHLDNLGENSVTECDENNFKLILWGEK